MVSQSQIDNEKKAKNAADMKEAEEAYKKFYTAKEKLYEIYKRDGKMHTDTYTDPDGTVHSTSIYRDSRCDVVSGSSGATSTCE